MDEHRVKNYLISIIERGLKGHAQQDKCALFTKKIAAMPNDIESVKGTIRKIRMAIRLLVDEELADDLYEEMMAIVAREES